MGWVYRPSSAGYHLGFRVHDVGRCRKLNVMQWRAYRYISDLFSSSNDLITTAAVSAVTSNSLDTNATGGVLTHKGLAEVPGS